MGHRHEVTDEQWKRLEPLLPRARRGPQPRALRRMVNGILWLDKTGAPWRDLPERYGPWRTVASRYYRWLHAGVWERVLAALQAQGDQQGQLNWELHHVDSTVIRAHQHAAGARRTGAKGVVHEQALGRSQGGVSTKLHLRAEGGGKPMTLLVTAGQRHEQPQFVPLMERGAVKRPGRGRPRIRPRRVAGDKAYSSGQVRRYLRGRGIGAVIPRKANERHRGRFDRAAYRERNQVERLINRLKQFRRVATRYEKLAVSYLAMVTLAAVVMWL
jgi:transposase